MKIQLNVLGIIIILAVVFATFYFGKGLGRLDRDNQLHGLSHSLNQALQTKEKYKIKIDSLIEQVSQMEYVLVNDVKIIQHLEEDAKRLRALNIKDVETIAKLDATVAVLNKKLEYLQPNVLTIDSDNVNVSTSTSDDPKPCLELPVDFAYEDKWAYNRTTIDTLGEVYSDFGLYPSRINIIIGQQKDTWYKKKEGIIAVTTLNPYLAVDPENVILVKDAPKWYQRKIVWLAGGLIGGLLIP